MSIDTPGFMAYILFMPRRSIIIATGEVYHLFNRTVGHEEIFSLKRQLHQILAITDYYRFNQPLRYSKFKQLSITMRIQYLNQQLKYEPIVDIFSYSFMPNHFHFLLKQLKDNGIRQFISNIQNSYARFFNLKNNRHGTLFTNPFKAKHIETDEQLIHSSRYIHLNHVTGYLINIKELFDYPWSSFHYYVDSKKDTFINREPILNHFGTSENYIKFVVDQADYQRKLKLINHVALDGNLS